MGFGIWDLQMLPASACAHRRAGVGVDGPLMCTVCEASCGDGGCAVRDRAPTCSCGWQVLWVQVSGSRIDREVPNIQDYFLGLS